MSTLSHSGAERRAAPHGLPRLLLGLDGSGQAMALERHLQVHGPLPEIASHELIEEVERSGLRGRGGADFPTAHKLAGIAERARSRRRRGPITLIVNGSETEPASGKDRLLFLRLPHLVLDGAVLAARAVGAEEILVKLSDSAVRATAAVQDALSARGDEGIPIEVVSGPDGYVTGEESAVVNLLERGVPVPTFVPPRVYERGYRGGPTLVQNPETLAQIALVARHGDLWYRELGTAADPGSALITISGAVAAPGVFEFAFGTPMSDLLAAAGGSSEPLQALLVGGYFGTWVPAGRAMRLRLSREDLRTVGCSLGSGVVIALGESACGLHETARVIDYLARQSAGQCGPCVYGLGAIADGVAALAGGTAGAHELDDVTRWAFEVRGRGACHHPDGASRFVLSALEVFAPEIERHRRERCRAADAGLPFGGGGSRGRLTGQGRRRA